ncbi:MAG TPA: GvpL/GvpF family gas vesicle protein [Amycolatopsis sp.]|nr:GvpL/GvpF family gas vesicle protein [Amycolatopsis sp.]
MNDHGIWLYAVTARADRPLVPGVAGEPVRLVEAAGLTAVVGDVPLASFGEEALYRNLEDLDWLAGVARAHDAVVATVPGAGPVVPVRLATVYRDDDGVRAMLERRAADCHRSLDRVTGRTEWGVKVFAAPAMESTGESTVESTGGPAGPSRGGAGTAYLARRRAALVWRERHEQRAAEQAESVRHRLAQLAAGARRHPPQSRTLTGDNGRMIGNLAYLVDDDRGTAFTEAVTACDQEHDAIRVELTGPWPPYSFAALEEP